VKNNLVIVVLDSLRYDAWVAAAPPELARLGSVQRRWSYASWTAPSHVNLLMGLLPHTSPPGVLASDHYQRDFLRYRERLGIPDIDFTSMLPGLWLPSFLQQQGYATSAMVSMPVLNPHTATNRGFDAYRLMDHHNDMSAMLPQLTFSDEHPSFYLLNVGETHYPYAVPGEDTSRWPRISGLHGVLGHMPASLHGDSSSGLELSAKDLRALQDKQIDAVGYVDGLFARLYDLVPDNTWIVVTSDHGELFGEEGYFGHGPIMHEKVFEVPFVEGRVPR
jgi:arylsulfatase A-like enzyme